MIGTPGNTIKKYVRIWHGLVMTYDEFSAKSYAELSELFSAAPSAVPDNVRRYQLDDLLTFHAKRLNKKGVTREMIHREYVSRYHDGYSRSQLTVHCVYIWPCPGRL
ncbi:MAG: hypothetical protein LIO79_00445 [Rikenellaceae bacterium]|nr:hypothetical protein [Rikenellaceae bacterium]